MKMFNALIFTLVCLTNNTVYAQDKKIVSFFMEAPSDLVSLSRGGHVGIALFPTEILSMVGTSIPNTLLLTARVRDTNGKISRIISELKTFPDRPVMAETVWDIYLTVVIPGRGTPYVYHKEQLSTEIFKVMDIALKTRQDWIGEIITQNTVGPLSGKRGLIAADTGELENATGWFVEIGTLRGYTGGGDMSAGIELRFTLTNKNKD